MSGGTAYVLDVDGSFASKCNMEMIEVLPDPSATQHQKQMPFEGRAPKDPSNRSHVCGWWRLCCLWLVAALLFVAGGSSVVCGWWQLEDVSDPSDEALLKNHIQDFAEETGSPVAHGLLADWAAAKTKFVKVDCPLCSRSANLHECKVTRSWHRSLAVSSK